MMTTAIQRVMPAQHEVARLLSTLLGRQVTAVRVAPLVRRPADALTAVLFARDDGAVAVVALANLAFTVFGGAALTMFPPPVAQGQVTRGELDPVVLDNFREVMNVCASQFNTGTAAHVSLTRLLQLPAEALPKDAERLLSMPRIQLDLSLEIPGYGSGRLSYFLR